MFATGYAAVVGSLMFALLPTVLSALERETDFSRLQIGAVTSAPMFGMFVGAIIAAVTLESISRRSAAVALVATITLVYALVGYLSLTFAILAAALFVGGVAGAMLMGIGFGVMARTVNPDRTFAFWVAAQLSVLAITLPAFGLVIDRYGLAVGIAALGAGTLTAAGPFLRRVGPMSPLPGTVRVAVQDGFRAYAHPAAGLAMLAIVLFGAGIMVVWVHAESVGVLATGSPERVRSALSASLLVGIIAALAAGALAGRTSRSRLLAATSLLCFFGALAAVTTPGTAAFLLGVTAFSFGWNLAPAPQIGCLATIDPSGRLAVANIAALKLGYALGPLVGAVLPTEGSYWMHAVLCGAAITCSGWILTRLDHRSSVRKQAF